MRELSNLLASAAAAILANCGAAYAQEAVPAVDQTAGPDTAEIGEIIVTAQKREERLQDVPAAVSAIGGDALQERNITNLIDIQTLVPNLNIQQRESSGAVTIRGIGFDVLNPGAEGSVAVHTDGVVAARPAAALVGLYDLSRVEIARGPQGTLYGRNATGGALNIITRKPTRTPEGYVNLTVGNYDAISIEGAIGGPLTSNLAARVAFRTEDRDGFGTNLFDGSDIEDLNTRAFRAQLAFDPTDTLSFVLSYDYFRERDNAFVQHYGGPVTGVCSIRCGINNGGQVSPDERDVNQNTPSSNRRKYQTLALTGTLDLSDDVRLTSITGYRDGMNFWRGDLDATSANLSDVDRIEDTEQFSEELQLSGDIGALEWLIGGFYFHERNDASGTANFVTPPVPIGRFFTTGVITTDAYAGFGQATYNITDALRATVGARYSHERKRITDEVLSVVNAPSASRAEASVSYNAFTPKLGLEYHFDDDRMIFINAQKGFKSGSFAVGAVSPAFDPEEVWSYEGGIKAQWFNRRLTTNLNVFHYDYSNLQVGLVRGTILTIDNAGSADVDGVELELRGAITDRFSIDATGSWLNARFADFCIVDPARPIFVPNAANPTCIPATPPLPGQVPRQLAGNSIAQSPEWSGNFGAEYALPLANGELTLRGEVYLSSKVYFSAFNLETNSQDAYALGNLFATWRSDNDAWNVTGFVRNVGDKQVRAGSFVTTGLVGSIVATTLLPPRTYGVTVGRKF